MKNINNFENFTGGSVGSDGMPGVDGQPTKESANFDRSTPVGPRCHVQQFCVLLPTVCQRASLSDILLLLLNLAVIVSSQDGQTAKSIGIRRESTPIRV